MTPIVVAVALVVATLYTAPVVLRDDRRVFRLALIIPVGWLLSCVAVLAGVVGVSGWLIGMTLTVVVLVRAVVRTRPAVSDRPIRELSDADLRAIASEARRQSQQGGFLS